MLIEKENTRAKLAINEFNLICKEERVNFINEKNNSCMNLVSEEIIMCAVVDSVVVNVELISIL
jgi:hypothetical protein